MSNFVWLLTGAERSCERRRKEADAWGSQENYIEVNHHSPVQVAAMARIAAWGRMEVNYILTLFMLLRRL
jgi:hypothetical protein